MLVNKPIWILDDPFNGLDNKSIINAHSLLKKSWKIKE